MTNKRYHKLLLWDTEITNMVMQEAVRIEKISPTPLTLAKLLQQAQLVLPQDKRMSNTSLQSYSKHSVSLRNALIGSGFSYPSRGSPRKTVRTKLIESFVQHNTIKEVKEDPVVTVGSVFDSLFKLLMTEIKKEITIAVREALPRSGPSVIDEEYDNIQEIVKPIYNTKKNAPNILVVGLLPVQETTLENKIKTNSELRVNVKTWNEEGLSLLKDRTDWADCVFIMTKFISHQTQNIIKKRDPTRIIYCNGSVSDLMSQILAYVEK